VPHQDNKKQTIKKTSYSLVINSISTRLSFPFYEAKATKVEQTPDIKLTANAISAGLSEST